MKIALIVPYFGKLPGYFQLFLDSCRRNPGFDWLLFTDDQSPFSYPSNVHRIEMDFPSCRELIQGKFSFPIALPSPQKLCDFKCAYGYIFEEILTGYDWWGHCDLDQIFGCLEHFITPEMLQKYDKLFSLGHLTLYRNTPENNRVFCSTSRHREVFTTGQGCGFDEWLPGNINEIYLQSGRNVSLENLGADINPYRTVLTTVDYKIDRRCYEGSPIQNSIFHWDNGLLHQVFEQDGQLQSREYPYIHLQKRKMRDDRKDPSSPAYYILPNCFADAAQDPKTLLHSCQKWKLLNHQFFRVKWKSLQLRIQNRDWKYHNVFR